MSQLIFEKSSIKLVSHYFLLLLLLGISLTLFIEELWILGLPFFVLFLYNFYVFIATGYRKIQFFEDYVVIVNGRSHKEIKKIDYSDLKRVETNFSYYKTRGQSYLKFITPNGEFKQVVESSEIEEFGDFFCNKGVKFLMLVDFKLVEYPLSKK